jgi:hypothetical protein
MASSMLDEPWPLPPASPHRRPLLWVLTLLPRHRDAAGGSARRRCLGPGLLVQSCPGRHVMRDADSGGYSRQRWCQTARIARGWPQPTRRRCPGPVLRIWPRPGRHVVGGADSGGCSGGEGVGRREESTGMAPSRSPVPPGTRVPSPTSRWSSCRRGARACIVRWDREERPCRKGKKENKIKNKIWQVGPMY